MGRKGQRFERSWSAVSRLIIELYDRRPRARSASQVARAIGVPRQSADTQLRALVRKGKMVRYRDVTKLWWPYVYELPVDAQIKRRDALQKELETRSMAELYEGFEGQGT